MTTRQVSGFQPKGVRCAFSSQSDSLALNLPPSQTTAWRAVVRVLRSTADSLASVLFPADCRVCGEPLAAFSRVPVCPSCWKNLPGQDGPLCSRCGECLVVSDCGEGSGELCRPCRMVPPEFERALALGLYAGSLRTLLHLLKYDGLEPIASRLGSMLAAHVAAIDNLPPNMLVVPVPLYKARKRRRGFNQSEFLARSVCEAMRRLRPGWVGEPVPGALLRKRDTRSQAELTIAQRRRNLRGVFSASQPEAIRGRDVLLVDDIYTTGATARACSAALKKAGAATVWVATVARAQRQQIRFAAPAASLEVPMQDDFVMWNGAIQDGGTTQ